MKNIFALMLLLPICSALSGNENLPFTTTNADSLNVNRSFVHTPTMLSPNADSMLQEFPKNGDRFMLKETTELFFPILSTVL